MVRCQKYIKCKSPCKVWKLWHTGRSGGLVSSSLKSTTSSPQKRNVLGTQRSGGHQSDSWSNIGHRHIEKRRIPHNLPIGQFIGGVSTIFKTPIKEFPELFQSLYVSKPGHRKGRKREETGTTIQTDIYYQNRLYLIIIYLLLTGGEI